MPVSANETGEITLSNGVKLKLAGLECNNMDLKKYIATGYQDEQYIYVYVWDIDVQFSEALNAGLKGLVFAPAYSSINETALTSKWCKPIKQKFHKFYDRYIELCKSF